MQYSTVNAVFLTLSDQCIALGVISSPEFILHMYVYVILISSEKINCRKSTFGYDKQQNQCQCLHLFIFKIYFQLFCNCSMLGLFVSNTFKQF